MTEPTLNLWHQSTVPAVGSSVSSLLIPFPGEPYEESQNNPRGVPLPWGVWLIHMLLHGPHLGAEKTDLKCSLDLRELQSFTEVPPLCGTWPHEDTHWSRTLAHTPIQPSQTPPCSSRNSQPCLILPVIKKCEKKADGGAQQGVSRVLRSPQ